MLLKADADASLKNKHGLTARQYYQKTTDAYDIDPFVVKTLREMEERITKQKIQADLEAIDSNRKIEEEKKKEDFLNKRKSKAGNR